MSQAASTHTCLCTRHLLAALLLALSLASNVSAQTTTFTYQGKLADNNAPANGNYDFQFSLFDAVSGGTQQGTTQTVTNQLVTNGIFSVQLDFVNCSGCSCPTCFNGAPRFLAIAMRPTGGGAYTPLSPRQPLTATPYAVKSMNAANATTADGLSVVCVNCVTSSQIASVNGSAVTGTIPVASVPSGSANYIQNTTSPQAASDFNISGDGTLAGTLNAGVVNSTAQYNIGSLRAFYISDSTATNTNTVVGVLAGAQNPTGKFNSFFGCGAGQSTTAGGNNSFFGCGAGGQNQTGSDNAFFGRNAGQLNTASDNAFFGSFAGAANTFGTRNAFFGKEAGRSNTGDSFGLGSDNSFFGNQAGVANTTGHGNAFFGALAGFSNTTGCCNAFFGYAAGSLNTTGNSHAFFGYQAGSGTTTGADNAFFGRAAGLRNTTGSNNTFIGNGADFTTFNPTGSNNTLLGYFASVTSSVSNGTAIGAGASVTQSDSLVLGNFFAKVGIGTTAPTFKLHVLDSSNNGLRVQNSTGGGTVASFGGNGAFQVDAAGTSGGRFYITEDGKVGIGLSFNGSPDKLAVNGTVSLLLASGGSTQICQNGGNQLSTCSSSLRYKKNIASLHTGLSPITRLRPVSFNWKANNEPDLGLVAEEVAKVEPLLITHNDKGEIEGVKYDRVAVVLINAVKEQQAQIERQQHLIERQQHQIEALQTLVCSSHRKAQVCK